MLFLPSSNEWYVFLTVIGNYRNFQEDRSRKKKRSYPGLFGIYKIIPSYESHTSAQYYATSLIIPPKTAGRTPLLDNNGAGYRYFTSTELWYSYSHKSPMIFSFTPDANNRVYLNEEGKRCLRPMVSQIVCVYTHL